MMKFFSACILFVFFITGKGYAQQATNTDPSKSFVNVNIPKTPESAGFEKYGYAQVNEFTGSPNIAIPIYNLKSRFLEAPITLTYQANGIRVNQEASWVGLGFDLIAGGRITVETRGSVDFSSSTVGLTTPALQTGMTQIFNHLGNHRDNAVLTPATFWDPPAPCIGCPVDTNLYNGDALSEMTQFGTGEPDIFRANFMGHSLTFYVDKITHNINFIGEQSTFRINYTLDGFNNITGWTLVDDDGVSYYFNQTETTTNTLTSSAIVPTTTTSAWLLTQAVHPCGDYIQFSYNTYGYSVPAFSMSGSVDVAANASGTNVSSDQIQNISIQSPYYLTRMETSAIAVDFILDTRTDLYGPGSRKVSQIKVTDKLSNVLKKTTTFNYSYFQGTADVGIHNYLNTLYYNLPPTLSASSYLASSNTRLRLDSVNVYDNIYQPPYRFYYNNSIGVPDKYSYSQDHWGFYNGATNTTGGYSFSHLVPLNGSQGVQSLLPPNNLGFNTAMIGNSRECDSSYMLVMTMDSIVYPTGGSTKYELEPHKSTMIPSFYIVGGGLRLKQMRNYVSGNLIGKKEYSYSSGKYMGTINYFTTSVTLPTCTGGNVVGHFKYSSNGAVNANEILIGYGLTTITEKDPSGVSNGSIVKTFNTYTPSSYYANGIGFDIQAPYFASGEPQTDVTGHLTFDIWLDAAHKNMPPTPSANMEGKLMQEQYFDNSNNLLKSTNYYYHLANYTNYFYDVKAIQNRDGGFTGSCGSGYNHDIGYATGGLRAVNLFVSPAKSFHTLTDSVIEATYQGTNTIFQKKSYTYDSRYKLRSESIYNSDNSIKTTSYTHPYDYLATGINGNTTLVYQMSGSNQNNIIFSTTTVQNGIPIDSIFNLYHNPSSGVYVPQNTQIQVGANPIEVRQVYNSYDNYGHLIEKQKPGGIKENYLWGYDKQFPVAYIVGSDYTSISAIVSSTVLNNPGSDGALRAELNKLRVQLPNALVTTYTYDPVFGMTSVTNPNGKTNYYEYDGMGRMALIRDQDNNIIKRICYNYSGQQESCPYFYNNIQSGSFTRNNCGTGFTGGAATYSVAAGQYGSAISQADADAKALADVNANGQAYANANAACFSSCSFSMFSGYSSPTNSISNDGTNASFYIAFYSTSTLQPGNFYTIATINGGCRPSGTRTLSYTTGGRTWSIVITPGGQMMWKIVSGPALNANSTVSTSTLTYSL